MRRTRAGFAVVAGGLLAVLLGLWLRPNTGPSLTGEALNVEEEIARRTPKGPTSPPPANAAALIQRAIERADDPRPAAEPKKALDPDTVYDSDLLGAARAAMARKEEILTCLRKQEAAGTTLPQRVSIHFQLEEAGEESRAFVSLDHKGDQNNDIADACLKQLFADVRFDELMGLAEFVWPFPSAWLDEEPTD